MVEELFKTSLIGTMLLIGVRLTLQPPVIDPTTYPLEDSVLKDLPSFTGWKYKALPYIATASSLQKIGKNAAIRTLVKWSLDEEHGDKVFVLCRMLFNGKAGEMIRGPRLGLSFYLGETKCSNWPRDPIELIDGVPFLVITGLICFGLPEPPWMYLDYCLTNGDWNTEKFQPKTPEEMKKALDKLLSNPKLKNLGELNKNLLAEQLK